MQKKLNYKKYTKSVDLNVKNLYQKNQGFLLGVFFEFELSNVLIFFKNHFFRIIFIKIY